MWTGKNIKLYETLYIPVTEALIVYLYSPSAWFGEVRPGRYGGADQLRVGQAGPVPQVQDDRYHGQRGDPEPGRRSQQPGGLHLRVHR